MKLVILSGAKDLLLLLSYPHPTPKTPTTPASPTQTQKPGPNSQPTSQT
jgi:hypothetical protein